MVARARKSNATVPVFSLAVLVAAGPDGMMVPVDKANALAAAGHAEVKPGSEVNGEVQTRATQAGIDAAAAEAAANPQGAAGAAGTTEAPKEKLSFTIEEGILPPETGSRTGGRTELYPFDALGAPRMEPDGQGGTRVVMASFFVAKEPKSLASTVTGARNRYATPDPSGATRTLRGGATGPVMVINRDFKAYPAEKDGVKGTRIFRTK